LFAVLQLTACKNQNRDSELRQAWPQSAKPIPAKTIACNLTLLVTLKGRPPRTTRSSHL
jgi:hypothetical protein